MAFFIPMAQSLKGKRMVLRSLKDRLKNKFNVSVAELDGQDKWQVATLGVTMVSSDQRRIDQSFQHILSFVEQCDDCEITDSEVEFY